MGCHTWTFRKATETKEELIEYVTSLVIRKLFYPGKFYNCLSVEQKERRKKRYTKILNWLEKGYITENLDRIDMEYNLWQINGEYYWKVDYGNALFRVREYDLTFHNLKETEDHVLSRDYETNLNLDLLFEFWRKYPDGLIETG